MCHPVFVSLCSTATASVEGQVNDNAPDTQTYFCAHFGSIAIPALLGTSDGKVAFDSRDQAGEAALADCQLVCNWSGPGGCGRDDNWIQLFTNCGGSIVMESTATAAVQISIVSGGTVDGIAPASISSSADDAEICDANAVLDEACEFAFLYGQSDCGI
jgi:hypothetical protein